MIEQTPWQGPFEIDTKFRNGTATGTSRKPLAASYPFAKPPCSGDRARCRRWDIESGDSVALTRASKVTRLRWLSDGSGFFALELMRAFAVFPAGGIEPVFEVRPDTFETRYFLDAVLLADRTFAILVEDQGLLLAHL